MASTQALPSDVHATTVEQVEKDKEDIPLSKEDDKKTVIEETPEVPEVVTAEVPEADDKQPESVIGTEAEKQAPIVDAPVEVEVDISAPKTEQEPVSIKEEEKPVIEVIEKEVDEKVAHEDKAEKPADEAVESVLVAAEATEDKPEKPTSKAVKDEVVDKPAPEPVAEETKDEVVEHVAAVAEHEEKPIAEVVEDVPVVEPEEKPAAEAVQDSEPEIKNPAEQVTQEQEEKPTAEVVEDVPSEKNVAESKEESTTVTKLAEQVTQSVDEVKTDAPTEEEAKNGDSGIVASSRDMATEEVVVKTKQSGNIMSKVKQSLVKVKKAIIGKSPSSKALSPETKVEVKAK